jgi:hypothetical protein
MQNSYLDGLTQWELIQLVATSTYQENSLRQQTLEAWREMAYYAHDNFKEFLTGVLSSAIEERTYISIRVEIVIHGNAFYDSYYIRRVPDISYSSSYLEIFVSSNRSREFAVSFSPPSEDILFYPSKMYEYISRVIAAIEAHIANNDNWRRFAEGVHRTQNAWQWTIDDPVKKVNKRAEKLLLSHCTKKQRKQYKANQYFVVIGGETGTMYRIRRASQINIDVFVDGEIEYKLCTVADPRKNSGLPIEDQLLAQKTMIELQENHFLEIAKRWEL